jgi:hypothetical protein
MPVTRRSEQPQPPGPVPALVLSELGWWKAALAADGPPPDLALAPRADTAGLQFLASALRWAPGRLTAPLDDSPVGQLWRRLGLDDPADADPVVEDGRALAFRDRAQ